MLSPVTVLAGGTLNSWRVVGVGVEEQPIQPSQPQAAVAGSADVVVADTTLPSSPLHAQATRGRGRSGHAVQDHAWG